MARFQEAISEKWVIYPVNVGEDREKVESFVKEVGWTGEVILDSDKTLAKAFGVRVFPTTMFLDKKGHLVMFTENEIYTFQIIGGRKWDAPKMIRTFTDIKKTEE